MVGISDLAEICTLCAIEHSIVLVGILDSDSKKPTFAGLKIAPAHDELEPLDALIITDAVNPQQTFDTLKAKFLRQDLNNSCSRNFARCTMNWSQHNDALCSIHATWQRKSAAGQLSAQGRIYLPQYRKTISCAKSERYKYTIISRYLFVKIDPDRNRWRSVNNTRVYPTS